MCMWRRTLTESNLRGRLYRIAGADLTAVPGIRILKARTIWAEIGLDLSKFPSSGAFASCLGLCPDNDINGGKVLSAGTRIVSNRAAPALRMAANALHPSKSRLGDFYRRMRSKMGAPRQTLRLGASWLRGGPAVRIVEPVTAG